MIQYQFFPRSQGITQQMQEIINCFKEVEDKIDSEKYNLKSNEVLKKLEKNHSNDALNGIKEVKDEMQMSFFNLDDPLLEEIKEEILNLDINTLTPVEALMKLNEIKRMLTKK